ncbi:hypothetical protein MLD38_009914 [Melastoma candidum]|uniref:Uncharacterized protein n=1 Tax=Melastoma candidum TaxID=119954 RepID=A0ACB9QYQ1_9MYRT|nr:hypothetical protein MLD38_009914 [Melastoma candidum]
MGDGRRVIMSQPSLINSVGRQLQRLVSVLLGAFLVLVWLLRAGGRCYGRCCDYCSAADVAGNIPQLRLLASSLGLLVVTMDLDLGSYYYFFRESFGRGSLNGVRWLAAFLTVIWSFIHPSLVIIPYRDTAVTKSASFGFGVRIFATALCSTISISFRSRPDVPELMRRSGTMTARFFFSTLVFIRCSASPQHSLRGCD